MITGIQDELDARASVNEVDALPVHTEMLYEHKPVEIEAHQEHQHKQEYEHMHQTDISTKQG